MGGPVYAAPINGSCLSPDSDNKVTSMTEASSVTGKESESCSAFPSASEPVPTNAQQRGNRRRTSPNLEAWEIVKPEIRRLYLDENRRLKDVMAILGEQWGFWASLKMYKTKLTQWKFFKNNRQEDVAKLLSLERHRQTMGKESTFRRNGKPVDLAAYMRRKGLRPIDLLVMAQSGDLPPTLRCRTPPPSPPMLPKKIEAPDDFLLQEAYLHWTLDNPSMPPQMDARYFQNLDDYHNSAAMRSVANLTHGCWLLSIGRVQEGGHFCRKAFATVDGVLDTSAQFAVYELLGAVTRYPDPGIHRELWNYLAKYAAKIGRANDRLKRMLTALAKHARNFNLEHNVAMLQWGRRFSSKQSNGMFDGKPFDYTLLQPWDMLPMDKSYYHRYYISQALWEVDKIPSATIASLEAFEEPDNMRADLLLMFGNGTAWADDRISSMALKMLADMPRANPPRYLQFMCLYAVARNNRARCQGEEYASSTDHMLARHSLTQAAEVQSKAWERGKNYYETLTLLESWHREAGNDEEARITRMKREVECQQAFRALCV
ncbi:hypothetical protein HD806DRAFT_509382 [Xylariaceae sp. AK1471]|nr:hypothetical protein HD806DRAFT_509382 [Xylariaceae sp. AK1471]